MKIYLSRHSKTLWNEERRLQGSKDSPLSSSGIENALALKERLLGLHFDHIYSSPIPRSLETAKIVFDGQDIETDERLREMDFGPLEGAYFDEFEGWQKEAYHRLWHYPELQNGIPGGESYDSIEERARSFLHDVTHANNDRIFVMTHGFCFIILLATIMGLKRRDYPSINKRVVDGCSLTIVDYKDGVFRVEVYGENAYLPHISNENFAK